MSWKFLITRLQLPRKRPVSSLCFYIEICALGRLSGPEGEGRFAAGRQRVSVGWASLAPPGGQTGLTLPLKTRVLTLDFRYQPSSVDQSRAGSPGPRGGSLVAEALGHAWQNAAILSQRRMSCWVVLWACWWRADDPNTSCSLSRVREISQKFYFSCFWS